MPTAAIIPAAGSGIRFGETKQFKLLGKTPLFIHTLTPFLQSKEIREIILVVPKNNLSIIKKTIASLSIETDEYEKVKKTKMLLFPHLTLNMVFVGVVFILGGAVQTGSVAGWIHGLLFDLAFFHFLYTTILQHRGFKENVEIIGKLSVVDDPSENNFPA